MKNAYIRLLNEDSGNKEICRYNLSEDGGDNTALLFAELERKNGSWQFKERKWAGFPTLQENGINS